MRVLVTGGAGFIGSHVAERALAAKHAVAILDNLSTGRKENVPPGAEFFRVDLRGREDVLRVFSRFRPEVVCHQAAQASVAVSVREPATDAATNVIGTLNILDGARDAKARVVFASTGGAIYGEVPEGECATTSWPPRPASPNAAAKTAVEFYLAVYRAQYGLDYNILRYANVYGPRQDPFGEAGVVAIFLERILSGKAIQVNARKATGDPGCVRDYVYVGDVAAANLAAIEGRMAVPIANVGTGIGTSTSELAVLLERALGVTAEKTNGPPRAGDLERAVIDAEGCRRLLGEPTPLDRGLAETARWYKEHARR